MVIVEIIVFHIKIDSFLNSHDSSVYIFSESSLATLTNLRYDILNPMKSPSHCTG